MIGLDSKIHVWTTAALHLEKERRLAEDLSALGSRPPWWRRRARRHYDRSALWLKKTHTNDLRSLLAAQDPKHRAIMAQLIGWKLPTESQETTKGGSNATK
jgi:hypothetical protein